MKKTAYFGWLRNNDNPNDEAESMTYGLRLSV